MSIILDTISKIRHKNNVGKCSLESVKQAEEKLNLKFAEEYIDLITNFGTLVTDYLNLTSTIEDIEHDVVELTTKYRNYYNNFPKDMYVIFDVNVDGLVILQDATGKIYDIDETCELMNSYDSLNEFIKVVEGI